MTKENWERKLFCLLTPALMGDTCLTCSAEAIGLNRRASALLDQSHLRLLLGRVRLADSALVLWLCPAADHFIPPLFGAGAPAGARRSHPRSVKYKRARQKAISYQYWSNVQ